MLTLKKKGISRLILSTHTFFRVSNVHLRKFALRNSTINEKEKSKMKSGSWYNVRSTYPSKFRALIRNCFCTHTLREGTGVCTNLRFSTRLTSKTCISQRDYNERVPSATAGLSTSVSKYTRASLLALFLARHKLR